MERHTVTTIDKLISGDRFYKASDKKKQAWQVVPGEVKKTHFQTYRFFAKRDTDKHPTPINKSTPIVFLRHTN